MKEKSTSLVLRFNRNQQFILLSLAMAVRLPAQRESPRFFLASRSQVSWPQLSHKEVRKDSCTRTGLDGPSNTAGSAIPTAPPVANHGRSPSIEQSLHDAFPSNLRMGRVSQPPGSGLWVPGSTLPVESKGSGKKIIPHQGTWTYPFGWALVWKSK